MISRFIATASVLHEPLKRMKELPELQRADSRLERLVSRWMAAVGPNSF